MLFADGRKYTQDSVSEHIFCSPRWHALPIVLPALVLLVVQLKAQPHRCPRGKKMLGKVVRRLRCQNEQGLINCKLLQPSLRIVPTVMPFVKKNNCKPYPFSLYLNDIGPIFFCQRKLKMTRRHPRFASILVFHISVYFLHTFVFVLVSQFILQQKNKLLNLCYWIY
jgi:hypothetical protein